MKRVAAAMLLAVIAAPAGAHPGHGAEGMLAGMAHPFMGADHLLAMLALGWMAARLGGRAVVALPAAFLGLLCAGAALGLHGWTVAGVDALVAASVLVSGILMALRAGAVASVAVPLATAFAVFHGMAHAAEVPAGTSSIAFLSGMVVASACLHMAGMLLSRITGAARLSGIPVAVAGAVMLVQPVIG